MEPGACVAHSVNNATLVLKKKFAKGTRTIPKPEPCRGGDGALRGFSWERFGPRSLSMKMKIKIGLCHFLTARTWTQKRALPPVSLNERQAIIFRARQRSQRPCPRLARRGRLAARPLGRLCPYPCLASPS